jgi:hypothetical protein
VFSNASDITLEFEEGLTELLGHMAAAALFSQKIGSKDV